MREQQRHLKKELEDVKSQAEVLINEWATLATEDGTAFLREKLGDQGKRRGQIEESPASLKIAIGEVERDTVDQELVVRALTNFSEVFAEIKPYQQKKLMRLLLHKAILGPDYMKMALRGRPPEIDPTTEGEPRFQTFRWLARQMSQSVVLWDSLELEIK